MIIVITRIDPTNHSFLYHKDHYIRLRDTLCPWVTNMDI